jgi:hypothetical protein
MIRNSLFTILMLLFVSEAPADQVATLREVRTVCVDSFGNAEGADLIREKVINRIVKSGKLSPVENRESADAVLTGIGEISKGVAYSASGGSASGGTRYDATLVVRLVGKDKKILWVEEAKPGFLSGSASSSVADKIVKSLLKAIEQDAKAK